MSLKVLNIIGARPQFVKCAVVSRAIRCHNESADRRLIEEFILHTGQHYDTNMSDIFLDELKIKVNTNLGIREESHGKMTAAMLVGIENILGKIIPDVVIVYGDTNSTLAGALAASKVRIPVAHVEAGLRSFNMDMPEEINRIVTDRLSTWLFCPTQTAVTNLRSEGVIATEGNQATRRWYQHALNVGDVMYDAFLLYRKLGKVNCGLPEQINGIESGFYLATVHRTENIDNPKRLRSIMTALDEISNTTPVVLPIHPRTMKAIKSLNIEISNIQIIEPVGYLDMLKLLYKCDAVFTDSGGLQKESFFAKKLCVTLRDETEWMELVENGFNLLAGASKDKIVAAVERLYRIPTDWDEAFYGDGRAGKKIVETILKHQLSSNSNIVKK